MGRPPITPHDQQEVFFWILAINQRADEWPRRFRCKTRSKRRRENGLDAHSSIRHPARNDEASQHGQFSGSLCTVSGQPRRIRAATQANFEAENDDENQSGTAQWD
jgi:hypothetical protein